MWGSEGEEGSVDRPSPFWLGFPHLDNEQNCSPKKMAVVFAADPQT